MEVYSTLASIYLLESDYFNAQVYNNLVYQLARENDNKNQILNSYYLDTEINQRLEKFQEAFNSFQQYLSLRDSVLFEERIKEQNLLDQQSKLERTEKELQLILAEEVIKDLEISGLRLSKQQQEQELTLLKQERLLNEKQLENEVLRALEAKQSLLLAEEQFLAEQKDQQIKILNQENRISDLKLREIKLQDEERNAKIELLIKENEINKLEKIQSNTFAFFLFLVLLIILLVLFFIYRGLSYAKKTNAILMETNKKPYAIFDYSEFPLVHVKLTDVEITDQNFKEYVDEVGKIYEKGRYAVILDATDTKYVAAKYRVLQGNALKVNKNNVAQFSIGMAIIAPSVLQRMLLEAVFMIKPYPSEVKVCKTKEEATEWINELLEKENTQH